MNRITVYRDGKTYCKVGNGGALLPEEMTTEDIRAVVDRLTEYEDAEEEAENNMLCIASLDSKTKNEEVNR